MTRDLQIYKAYIEAKANPKKDVGDVAHRFGISRATIYEVVNRVERGNPARIKIELEKARRRILWEYKYQNRYLAMPEKDRREGIVDELRRLIQDMKKDKFPATEIALLLKKNRQTVLHHLT